MAYIYENADEQIYNISEYTTSTYTVNEIYETVKYTLQNYRIPMLPMDLNRVLGDNTPPTQSRREEHDEEENADKKGNDVKYDIEEVFVRLNTKGTPLGGEELNYSLLKSRINKNLQDKIEDACNGIMKPARFVTLAYRLYENCEKKNESYVDMGVNQKQF